MSDLSSKSDAELIAHLRTLHGDSPAALVPPRARVRDALIAARERIESLSESRTFRLSGKMLAELDAAVTAGELPEKWAAIIRALWSDAGEAQAEVVLLRQSQDSEPDGVLAEMSDAAFIAHLRHLHGDTVFARMAPRNVLVEARKRIERLSRAGELNAPAEA